MEELNVRHIGRFGQIGVCLGRLYRMFVFQSDWKVLPMAAVIAALVSIAIGRSAFVTMEGTQFGTFALTCVCIWNGFFNSIQVICRERPIIKREHRAGLHMTSYVLAHMIYQMTLCIAQAIITLSICHIVGMPLPNTGVLLPENPAAEIAITLFLVTYAADMMALMVSAIVHTTTSAMTVMPFLLIIQLLFSDGYFSLPASISGITNLMISKWGMQCLCVQGNFNSLPTYSLWNTLVNVGGDVDLGPFTMKDFLAMLQENGGREVIIQKMSELGQKADYASTIANVLGCWGYLVLFAIVFAFVTIAFLEFIDRDRR